MKIYLGIKRTSWRVISLLGSNCGRFDSFSRGLGKYRITSGAKRMERNNSTFARWDRVDKIVTRRMQRTLLTAITHVANGDEGPARARRFLQGALVVVGHSVGPANLLGLLLYPAGFFHLSISINLFNNRLYLTYCSCYQLIVSLYNISFLVHFVSILIVSRDVNDIRRQTQFLKDPHKDPHKSEN